MPVESVDFEKLDPKKFIIIKGAKVNNLKNLSVAIPRNKMVVITGLSGSGKSSLAFDTLFAEGQRMYVESLNSYARQFLGRMEKPEVEYIRGVSPAIAVEQKVNTRNPRSTVGTTTEIYDYLKLLFSRVGKTYSPVSGMPVRKDSVSDVVDYIHSFEDGKRYLVYCPLKPKNGRSFADELGLLLQKGYTRVLHKGETLFIEEVIKSGLAATMEACGILIDRGVVKPGNEDSLYRAADSAQTAFFEGEGECVAEILGESPKNFSEKFEEDGMLFEEPNINFFSFNNSYGACKRCEGFGHVLGIDHDLVFPDKNLSVFEGVIAPWKTEKMGEWLKAFLYKAIDFDFPVHRSYCDLDQEHIDLLWSGNEHFKGLTEFFEFVESENHKIQYRVLLSRYRGRTVCPDCKGTRLRKDAGYVKIGGKSITDVVLMPILKAIPFFAGLSLEGAEAKVAQRVLVEIQNRLSYLEQVGLGYLSLNRLTSTLSGGEFQRIKLATSLGSALVGSMYILDEPSIGLHPRDTHNLALVLNQLKNMGNTVIIVEHEEEVMRAADQIIDIGPDAGVLGGHLIFQGHIKDMDENTPGHTAAYLTGRMEIPLPAFRRSWNKFIEVKGARENNLKNLNVRFPLEALTVVTGVSGSGKSTLIKKVLHPSVSRSLGALNEDFGKMDTLGGDLQAITKVEFVNQNPIGKSSRSNPVTYIKAYDAVRQLFADQKEAVRANLKPAAFSFNVEGGRCEMCLGEGTVKIEMQFMADIYLECESCKGKRFKEDILEIKHKEKSISEVLDMTVDESIIFFADQKKIWERLLPLQEVGLGYLKLGQSASTLSGGEAQRVKLASFLTKGGGSSKDDKILFIFDEPTTGLHFHDIKKLLDSFNALIEVGHSVIVIEHNMEVIKTADWVIDLGPDGGDGGGHLCFAGTPEELALVEDNHTARFLKEKLLPRKD